jgi:hypothetical protein
MRSGDASFARSFDPCASILTMHRGVSLGGGAFEVVSRSGKLAQARETGTGAVSSGRSAARHRSAVLARGRRGTRRKGRRSRPSSLRGSGARVWLLARRDSVAEVVRRRLTSNTLGKRAPKRAAGSSEQGSSAEQTSAGETVGGGLVRREQSRIGLTPLVTEEDRFRIQGDERLSSSGRDIAKSGGSVAGPGL